MQTAPPLLSLPPSALLLPALREGTHDLHERLENRLDLTGRLASLETYQTLLKRFYGFYVPLEETLATAKYAPAWSELGIVFADRRKARLLTADLHFFGLTPEQAAEIPKCLPDLWLPPVSAAMLAGCAYVMEGATLGGQLIGRHFEKALGLRPGEPGAVFFFCYGSRTGIMWQQFRRAAEAFIGREEASSPGSGTRSVQEAVAAARQTFAALEAWLLPAGQVEELKTAR